MNNIKDKFKIWKETHPIWYQTYKRLKTNEERGIKRLEETLADLETLHTELGRLQSKVGFLIGRLKKSNRL